MQFLLWIQEEIKAVNLEKFQVILEDTIRAFVVLTSMMKHIRTSSMTEGILTFISKYLMECRRLEKLERVCPVGD